MSHILIVNPHETERHFDRYVIHRSVHALQFPIPRTVLY